MTAIKASSLLREGAEAAITPVNNETITAIADWRDTTVIHNETDGGLGLRSRTHGLSAKMLGLASFISRLKKLVTKNPALTRRSQGLNTVYYKSYS